MKNWMEMNVPRRLLSLAVCAAMVFSLMPVFTFAEGDGLCEHHTGHTPECGYVAAVEGRDCGHVHDDSCGYQEAADCGHSHDDTCGYREARDCTHVCDDTCGYREEIPCGHVHTEECGEDGADCTHVCDGSCGYQEAADCTHVHDESCGYQEASDCTHVCDDTCGYQEAADCGHVHNDSCGYVKAVAGQPCNFVCTECAEAESKPTEPQPEAACALTKGCTLPNGHDGPCNAAPAHDCEGELEPVEGDEGEQLWGCPVCGALLDAWGNELPPIRTYGATSGTFNGSPAEVDENGNLLINETNFPDENFRNYVSNDLASGKDRLSEAEVAAKTEINCSSKGIASLKGIEYFTALTRLVCSKNRLTELDVSKNTALKELSCVNNWLTELDVSGHTALKELNCRGNSLTALDVSGHTALTDLNCSANQLTALDISGDTALTGLYCSSNQLTSLDVSSHTALNELDCSANQLTTLNVSSNTTLTYLSCSYNQLTTLDVSNHTKLTDLNCHNNQLTSLNVSNTALGSLSCENNRLAALDLTGLSISYTKVSGQTPEAVFTLRDGKLTADLAGLVGTENLSRVRNLSGGTMDSSGIVTVPVPDPPTGNIQISYQYDTRMQDSQLMPVTLTLMPRVPVVHDGTFNGSPAKLDENGNLVINADNFPDGRFRALVRKYDTDSDGSLSEEEVGAVTVMICESHYISDLKGIAYFTALTRLSCARNLLTTLDISKNTALIWLICDENLLTSLDVSSNTALEYLDCSQNRLTSLDVRGNKALTILSCFDNQLTALDVSQNTKLTELHCNNNQLTTLDVSGHTDLTVLDCCNNHLTTLDVSGNTALTNLNCSNNRLAALDLTGLKISTRNLRNQTPEAVLTLRDGKLTLDLGSLVGTENLSRVQSLTGGTMDSSGMVTIPIPADPTADIQVSYKYNTLSEDFALLPVTLTHTHSFDEDGNCACGLVKQVPYVDASGADLGTQLCIPITRDTGTLTGGWYVASGSVTTDGRLVCSGDVNLILEDGCELIVSGGIQVQDNSTGSTSNTNALTIYAQSTAEATMGELRTQNVFAAHAAIGGNENGSGGKITINGGIVQAEGVVHGAAIGGGGSGDSGGSGGEITINGGVVRAESGAGAAIGGGSGGGRRGGSGGEITITGGIVRAESGIGAAIGGGGSGGSGGDGGTITISGGIVQAESEIGAAIGGGDGGGRGSFSTGTNGNPVIFASSIGDQSGKSGWRGVIFEGDEGKVYGNPTLPLGLPIPEDKSLTLNMDGNSLTITGGITLETGSALTLSGPGSFPGGIFVTGGTLEALLPDGWAFTQNGKYVPVSGKTGLSGATSLSRITVTITTQPGDVSITYGADKALSVTAGPVTSGDTVTYQWYLDGSALTGETKNTLSLSGLDAGSYEVYCAVTCGDFTVDSDTVTVTVGKKTVTLKVTIQDKLYDKTTTAELGTVTLSGIVNGDSVQVVNGTPTFARSTPGKNIPVSFTEFKLEGPDALNYALTQPTGVTGRILPTPNYLDLTNNPDFAGQTEVWVDGVKYPIQTEDGRYVLLPDSGDLLTIYTYAYRQGSAHEQYPTGMAVYRIARTANGATVAKIGELDDLLQYSGCSIRITGKRGIRMITSLTEGNKKALTGSGLAGYTLEEYGTVVQWADTLGDRSLTLDTGKHNYAYKKGVADPVFSTTGDLIQYTNVLVWDSLTNKQLGSDIVMRPYIILRDGSGNPVTLYGGAVSRSIGYIAYQNRNVFTPGTAAYRYVWDIIHAVYGTQYDSEYQG